MTARFCLAVFLPMWGGAATAQYTISLHDRAAEVSAKFPGAVDNEVKFRLHSWAATDFFQDVSDVTAVDLRGRALAIASGQPGEWTVHNQGAPFTLRWHVRSGKNAMIEAAAGSQFHVTLLKDWAVMWGHAFVLLPAEGPLARDPVRVRLVANEYLRWDSTLPANRQLAHLSELADQLFVAGAFRVYREAGRRYYFSTAQQVVKDRELMWAVDRIFVAQVREMGVSPIRSPMFVFTDGRSGSSGGTVVRNSAVFYPDLTRDLAAGNAAALRLIAHEIFHLWNGSRMNAKNDAEWSDGRYGWFKEGFTEYYSGATLYREGILDNSGFATFLNGLIREYAQNGESRHATLEDMGARHWRDRDHQRLPYCKGALVALLMDAQLHAHGRRLDDYMRAMLRHPGYGMEELRAEWVRLAGGAGARFWDDFIPTAAPLPFAEVFRAAGLPFDERETEIFELGFTIDRDNLVKGAKVTSVKIGSRAAAAGIAVGDSLEGFSIYNGDPSKAAKLNLLRGEQKVSVSYIPATTQVLAQLGGELGNLK